MKRMLKCSSRWASAMFAASLAIAMAPVLRAQAQSQTVAPGNSTAQSSSQVQDRLQDLEIEVSTLQREIAALRASDSGVPTMRTAALVEPIAQQAPPESTPAAAPAADAGKTTVASLLGPTSFSGFVDAYYGFNFNQPSFAATGTALNGLQFFDAATNQFGLNMVELIVDKAPDPTAGVAGKTGYHVSLAFGQAINAINGSEPVTGVGFDQYLKEAYFSYLVSKAFQVDIGKFVTPMGAEVIESNANWNYSRAVLFYYPIPYYHFGARAKYTFNPKFSLTGFLVNGFNDVVDFSNAKTYGVTFGWNPSAKWSINENFMSGPQPESGNFNNTKDYTNLNDFNIMFTPNAKWSLMVDGVYASGPKSYTANSKGVLLAGPTVDYGGIATYLKYGSANNNLAVRYEYYSDPYGFTLFNGAGFNRGDVQEVTTTFTHMLASTLMTRFEYRYNFASHPIFLRGASEARKEQSTLTLGMVYSFDSRNAK